MSAAPSTTVQLLYFDGCPNYEALLPRLKAILNEAGTDATLELRRVESEEDVRGLRFLGSPTVRVDGRDVEPEAAGRDDFGLKCRLYRTPNRTVGTPPDSLIRVALKASSRSRARPPARRLGA